MKPILTLRNLSKSYTKDDTILNGVNLTLHENEIIAVVGNSGSGKTTLLRTIAGLERVDSGEIILDEQVVDGQGRYVPPAQRFVGYIFQEHALFPHLTVQENIAFGIHRLAAQKRLAIVDELLELLHISAIATRYPHQISGGQLQRVGIARALAPRPKILLLDEPFNNLDITLREAILPDLRQLFKEQHIAALCITHLPQEGFVLADKIAVLDQHHFVQVGNPLQLYRQPVNRDIAQFFGLINCFPARYSHRAEVIYLSEQVSFPFPQQKLPRSTTKRSAIELLLRPDEIEVFFNRMAYECHRTDLRILQGTIKQKTYFGHFQLLKIRIHEEDLKTDCVAHLPASTPARIGQRIFIGLPMRNVHITYQM